MDKNAATNNRNGHGFKVLVVGGSILAAIIWPVQAIAMFVLLAAAMACIAVYNTWLSHHAVERSHRRSMNHAIGDATVVVLGLGLVAAAIFPVATMAAALCLAVVACGVWGTAWIIEFLAATEPSQDRRSAELRSRQQHPATVSMRRTQNRERASTKAAA